MKSPTAQMPDVRHEIKSVVQMIAKSSILIILLHLFITFSSYGQTPKYQALDIIKLQNKNLQDIFFKQIDSILHVQYPNNDKEAEIFIDIDRKLLVQFLKDIDQSAFAKNKSFEKEYHFNIAPKGYTDPKKCKDKISVEFYPEECSYRMVIWNTFLVEDDWCTESQVIYSFSIKDDEIKRFSRNVAG